MGIVPGVDMRLKPMHMCCLPVTLLDQYGIVQVCLRNYKFRHKFLRLFERCTTDQCVLIAMISWAIWYRRSKWLCDKVNGSAFGVKTTAMHLLAEWKDAQVSSGMMNRQGGVGDCVWRRPPAGWIKINTDAALFSNETIGLGCVIRDDQGLFIGARCCEMSGAWTPREAEAWGM